MLGTWARLAGAGPPAALGIEPPLPSCVRALPTRAALGTAEKPDQRRPCPVALDPSPAPTGHPGTRQFPSSFATSAVNRRSHRSEQMSSVIFKRLSFFILTPRKNVSFTFCRARSLHNSGKLTNEVAATLEEPEGREGWGPELWAELSPDGTEWRGPWKASPLPPSCGPGLQGPSLSMTLSRGGLQPPLALFPRERTHTGVSPPGPGTTAGDLGHPNCT